MLENSAACPINTDFKYQKKYLSCDFSSHQSKDKFNAEYADILQNRTGFQICSKGHKRDEKCGTAQFKGEK